MEEVVVVALPKHLDLRPSSLIWDQPYNQVQGAHPPFLILVPFDEEQQQVDVLDVPPASVAPEAAAAEQVGF